MDPAGDLMQLQEAAENWATDRLIEDQMFAPFALAMSLDGELALVVDGDGLEPSDALQGFVRGLCARRDELRGVVICADARLPETDEDAMTIALEHVGELVLQVVLPYRLGDGTVEFGGAKMGRGKRQIWDVADE